MERRHLFAFGIVAFWLTMMALLVHREREWPLAPQPLAPSPSSASPREVSETLFGVFRPNGELAPPTRLGYVQLNQGPEVRYDQEGTRANLQARLSLVVLGKPSELRVDGAYWQGADLADLELEAKSADYAVVFTGKIRQGELKGSVQSAGETIPVQLPVDNELLLGNGLAASLRFPACEAGQVFRMASLDPLTLRKGQARIRCGEREELLIAGRQRVAQRLEIESGGLPLAAWVDEEGTVLRSETPLGLVLEQIDKAELLRPVESGKATAQADLAGATAIFPSGVKPIREAKRMQIRLSGAPPPPEYPGQSRRADGSWILESHLESSQLAGSTPTDLKPYLEPEALVQSRHPKILAQVTQILQGEKDPARQAAKIGEWVFLSLEKESVLSIPSALEVLERRRGDCNEHTVLFTALARAAGLPTRIAIGLVWSDDYSGFFYHAWPEVWLAGRWQGLDPTLGQERADATHLALLHGGIQEWPRVLPYFGQLRIEVLSVE